MRNAATATGQASRFTSQPIRLGGALLMADMSGALYWPDQQALIVADLHLEKGSAHAVRGHLLPPYDTDETLARLSLVLERLRPRLVVALGDSLHDRGASARLSTAHRASIAAFQQSRHWVWITGNHDPEIAPELGGEVAASLRIGDLCLQHAPFGAVLEAEPPSPTGSEIAGHMHPAARLVANGSSIRRPCFVADARRLVLPAFGAFTGGLNVLDAAFAGLIDAGDMRVWMLGQDGVYPVATRQLVADRIAPPRS